MAGLLEDKIAVVTGAGGGIGREIAIAMARAGAKVVINDVGASLSGEGQSATPAEETKQLIERDGGAAAISTDSVAEWSSAQKIVQAALDHFGGLDAVVNNAGVLRDQIFHRMTAEDWLAVISVHLNGSFFVSRAAADQYRKQEKRRLRSHHQHFGADRQYGPGELRFGQARHHGPVESDRDRHEAVQCAFELPVALGVEPHDPVDPGAHRRGAGAGRENSADDAGQERADGGLSRLRRGAGRNRSGVRHADERDLFVQLAAADPQPASGRRLDAGGDCRARPAGAATLVHGTRPLG